MSKVAIALDANAIRLSKASQLYDIFKKTYKSATEKMYLPGSDLANFHELYTRLIPLLPDALRADIQSYVNVHTKKNNVNHVRSLEKQAFLQFKDQIESSIPESFRASRDILNEIINSINQTQSVEEYAKSVPNQLHKPLQEQLLRTKFGSNANNYIERTNYINGVVNNSIRSGIEQAAQENVNSSYSFSGDEKVEFDSFRQDFASEAKQINEQVQNAVNANNNIFNNAMDDPDHSDELILQLEQIQRQYDRLDNVQVDPNQAANDPSFLQNLYQALTGPISISAIKSAIEQQLSNPVTLLSNAALLLGVSTVFYITYEFKEVMKQGPTYGLSLVDPDFYSQKGIEKSGIISEKQITGIEASGKALKGDIVIILVDPKTGEIDIPTKPTDFYKKGNPPGGPPDGGDDGPHGGGGGGPNDSNDDTENQDSNPIKELSKKLWPLLLGLVEIPIDVIKWLVGFLKNILNEILNLPNILKALDVVTTSLLSILIFLLAMLYSKNKK